MLNSIFNLFICKVNSSTIQKNAENGEKIADTEKDSISHFKQKNYEAEQTTSHCNICNL